MIDSKIIKILNIAKESIMKLMDADRFYAAFYDEMLRNYMVVINNDEINSKNDFKSSISHGSLPFQAIKSRKVLLFEKSRNYNVEDFHNGYWPDRALPKSWLCVPIIVENRSAGLLVVESVKKENAFGDRGVKIISSVANQTSAAIEKLIAAQNLHHLNQQLRAVHDISVQLTEGIQHGEKEIANLIKEYADKVMDTDNMYVALYDPNPVTPDVFDPQALENCKVYGTIRFELMYVDGEPKEMPPRKARPGHYGRTEHILATRKSILNQTKLEAKKWYKAIGHKNFLDEDETFAAWIGVPMITNDKIVGVIASYHKEEEFKYNEGDRQVLAMMARQAAVAIEKSKLYVQLKNLNELLEEKVHDKTMQSKALSELLCLNSLAGRLVHKINNLIGNIPIELDHIRISLNKMRVEDSSILEDLQYVNGQIKNLIEMARKLQKSTRKLKRSANLNAFEKNDAKFLLDKALTFSLTLNQDKLDKYEIKKQYTSRNLTIETIESLFIEALDNLISNALEAMPEGGCLRLVADTVEISNAEYVVIIINDSGNGIPANDYERIYDINYSKKPEGLGYGLWSVKRICDATGTKIDFVSDEGEGTSFTLTIPLSESFSGDN